WCPRSFSAYASPTYGYTSPYEPQLTRRIRATLQPVLYTFSQLSKSRRPVVCALLLLLSALASRDASAQAITHARPMHIALRAGTAAAPFGPATVISDFDADGAPDSAIADRTTRNGANYKIEVQLSGGSTQTMSFFSTKGALHFAALALDNDHDPALVVTPVLSHEVVGIWVNDGPGHFPRGRDEPYQSAVPIAQSVPAISGSSLALLAVMPG